MDSCLFSQCFIFLVSADGWERDIYFKYSLIYNIKPISTKLTVLVPYHSPSSHA